MVADSFLVAWGEAFGRFFDR